MIRIWTYEGAPDFISKHCYCGGDEDWCALVPYEMENEYFSFIENSAVERARIPEGIVYVSAHS